MTLVWAWLFGLAYFAAKGDRVGALWVAVAVASHWMLDFVSHRPGLPLDPWGGERLGLGLQPPVPATFAVEGLRFAVRRRGPMLGETLPARRPRTGKWKILKPELALADHVWIN